jgi:hypothetical protein
MAAPISTRPHADHADLIARLDALAPLAPLHQPHNLAGIRAAIAAFPDARRWPVSTPPSTAATPSVNDTFALPRRFYDEGVRRYGFHGLSYDYITGKLADDHPDIARAASSSPIWATARRSARSGTGARSAPPWASPRSTACPWAPARASSTPA